MILLVGEAAVTSIETRVLNMSQRLINWLRWRKLGAYFDESFVS